MLSTRRKVARLGLWAAGLVAVLLLSGCADRLEADIAVRTDGSWSGEARLSLPPAPVALPGVDQNLEAPIRAAIGDLPIGVQATNLGVEGGKQVYALSLNGQDVASLASLVARPEAAVEWLGGPAVLELRGRAVAGQALELALPANPSTGYQWSVEPAGAVSLAMDRGVQSAPIAPGLGAPARQVLHLTAGQTGPATIRLVYGRPWEQNAIPTRVFAIDARDGDLAKLIAAVSMPLVDPATVSLPGVPSAAELAAGLAQGPAAAQAGPAGEPSQPSLLPTSLSWCSSGICTPVRDQGACGSCWAFGTVGAMELNIKRAQGGSVNLSEQYLVSCNHEQWGCGGGWWAHDYHKNRFFAPETQAGSVPESSFPYVAGDVACGGPYTHPNKLISWQYLNPTSPYSVPSATAIKQAIYYHGPIAAAMCVGNAFGGYKSGVFATNESNACPGGVNHAVVLVGWNDADQTWVLRNSWGSGWGEAGYMRIRWGTSNVGYGATYVVYESTPPPNYDNHAFLPLIVRKRR